MTRAQFEDHQRRHGFATPSEPNPAAPRAVAGATVPLSPPLSPDSATAASEDQEPPDAFEGLEKLLHREFLQDMLRRGVHVVHARTDMVSTIALGTPDFHCMFKSPADGICRGAACEFKRKGGVLSARQRQTIDEMRRMGVPVIVAYTLKDAIDFMRKWLLC